MIVENITHLRPLETTLDEKVSHAKHHKFSIDRELIRGKKATDNSNLGTMMLAYVLYFNCSMFPSQISETLKISHNRIMQYIDDMVHLTSNEDHYKHKYLEIYAKVFKISKKGD